MGEKVAPFSPEKGEQVRKYLLSIDVPSAMPENEMASDSSYRQDIDRMRKRDQQNMQQEQDSEQPSDKL